MSRKLPKVQKLPNPPAKRPEDMNETELKALAFECGQMAELWGNRYQACLNLIRAKQEPNGKNPEPIEPVSQ